MYYKSAIYISNRMSCTLSALGPFGLLALHRHSLFFEVLMDLTATSGQVEPLLWLVMFFYAALSLLMVGFSVYRLFFGGVGPRLRPRLQLCAGH